MLSRKTVAYWLLGFAAAITALLLLLPLLIDSDLLKARLQSVVAAQTNGQLQYQNVELAFFPRPLITLRQIKINLPEQLKGAVGSLQVYPELFPLLTGQVRPAKLILESPVISLDLVGLQAGQEEPPSAFTFQTLQNSLNAAIKPLFAVAPALSLAVHNGTLTLNRGAQILGVFNSVELNLNLEAMTSAAQQVKLECSVADLTLHRGDRHETLQKLLFNGSLRINEEDIALAIDRLQLAQPALQLKGHLVSAPASPVFKIELDGTDLDVDAIRKTALTLAGDISPVREIFDSLRGGKIPKLSVHSHGESAAELGDLKNMTIDGRLQAGAVSVPQVDLDLTEVVGNVVIAHGILHGTGMSTRLEGSRGHDGSLNVALVKGNDLFQLELILSADLAQAHRILERIVDNQDFVQQVNKITHLQGDATGKLTLGDSLSDLNAKVDLTDMNLSFDYQGLPFPVTVSKGKLSFTDNRVDLKDLDGSFGRSVFSGVTGHVKLNDTPRLDFRSGSFGLVLDELYPFVASIDSVGGDLTEIKHLDGRLNLTALSFKGTPGVPEDWQFAATGAVLDIGLETPRIPGKVRLHRGDFTLAAETLSFQDFKVDSLDADLVLSGVLKGVPQRLEQVELLLDGTMGPDSVAWLQRVIGTAQSKDGTGQEKKGYTLRAPLTFSESKILWQPDATTSFKGKVSVADGPSLVVDVDHHSERLQVKQLAIKDQHSDAELGFGYGPEELDLNFTGTLHHKTLDSLFVEQNFVTGRLEGDFAAKASRTKRTVTAVTGHLAGDSLALPMSSGKKIEIERISFIADGTQVRADASSVSWNGFTWKPFKVAISYDQDKVNARVTEAEMCGITSTGLLTALGKNLTLDFILEGQGLDVSSSYSCLTEGRVRMSGTLDLTAKVSAQGEAGELLNNLRGPLEMTFTNGTIKQSKVLARTLEVLNVTEIVKGKLPDLGTTGFKYSTITVQGSLQGEKLLIEKAIMYGETLDAVGYGELNFATGTADVELLAAPFKTVDTVVRNLPGVNYLLAGSLVAIPVSVKGDLKDPRVRVMSASSVGSGLLNLGSRVIKSPIKLIETILPSKAGTTK